MRDFHPADYGPVLAPLVGGDRCRALDAGRPDESLRRALELATAEAAFAQSPVVDRDLARCVIAGLWLVHDFLDESHAVSQTIHSPAGSYWHGVMHRREGDFGNAKYWFRNAGAAAAPAALDEVVAALSRNAATAAAARRIASTGRFDPFAFVDACEQAVRGGADADVCRRVQQAEWELMFDKCYRGAVGTGAG